jgi:hypothetical protein
MALQQAASWPASAAQVGTRGCEVPAGHFLTRLTWLSQHFPIARFYASRSQARTSAGVSSCARASSVGQRGTSIVAAASRCVCTFNSAVHALLRHRIVLVSDTYVPEHL